MLQSFPLNPDVSAQSSRDVKAKLAISPGREREILYEQIVFAYREYFAGTVPVVFGGLLVVVVMWQDVPHVKLLGWLAMLYSVPTVADDLLEHPGRRRATQDHDQAWLPRCPRVPEVPERGEEARPPRREPGHLVEEHDLLVLAAAEAAGQERGEPAERLMPVGGRDRRRSDGGRAIEGAGELPELARQIALMDAGQLEADRRSIHLPDQERLAHPPAAVHRDQLGLWRPQRLVQDVAFPVTGDQRSHTLYVAISRSDGNDMATYRDCINRHIDPTTRSCGEICERGFDRG